MNIQPRKINVVESISQSDPLLRREAIRGLGVVPYPSSGWPCWSGTDLVESRTEAARRIDRNAAIIAAHPLWHGIRHPERIVFPEHLQGRDPIVAYHQAVLRAVRTVRESEELCRRISAVADAIDRRSWPWAASPHELDPKRTSRPRRLRTSATRFCPRPAAHVRWRPTAAA
jgi:hypothetical protein